MSEKATLRYVPGFRVKPRARIEWGEPVEAELPCAVGTERAWTYCGCDDWDTWPGRAYMRQRPKGKP